MSKHKRGFTLIELLVVIAIIAILAAILFPVFAKAKYSAKNTATLSNIKQVVLASIQYSNDCDDRTPTYMDQYFGDWPAQGTYNGWPAMFLPYTRNKDIVYDPVIGPPQKELAQRPSTISETMWYSYYPQIHMAFNGFPTISLRYSASWGGPRTMTGMQYIAERMAFAVDEPRTRDESDSAHSPYWQNGFTFERTTMCPMYSEAEKGHYVQYPPNLDSDSLYMGSRVHNYMIVGGYGDGHAKSRPATAITFNADIEGGNSSACVGLHMDKFMDASIVPTSKELDILKTFGKGWDKTW
jgi:prepilin-type N-terminal cleavage/methylation domain-containing protein